MNLHMPFSPLTKTNTLGNTRRAYHYDLGLFNRAFADLKVKEVTVQHFHAFLSATADRSVDHTRTATGHYANMLRLDLQKTTSFPPIRLIDWNR